MLFSKICIKKIELGKRKRQLIKNNLEEKENYSCLTEKENCFAGKFISKKEKHFAEKNLFLAVQIYQQKNRKSLLDRIRRVNKIILGRKKKRIFEEESYSAERRK